MISNNKSSSSSSSSGLMATTASSAINSTGAPPSTTRKMRRSREAQASSSNANNNNNAEELLSGFDLYEVQGNSASALDVFKSNQTDVTVDESSSSKGGGDAVFTTAEDVIPTMSTARTYNQILLSHATQKDNEATAASTTGDLLDHLQKFEKEYKSNKRHEYLPERKRCRNDFILAYNRALVLYTNGNTQSCIDVCGEYLHDLIQNKQKPADDVSMAAFRMAFLLLDVLLSLSLSGRHPPIMYSVVASKTETAGNNQETDTSTSSTTTDTIEKKNFPTLTEIASWLEFGLESVKDPQLKFSLSLYKSRVDLSERDHGKHNEAKIRSARKELKVAMELYQHKLRAAFGASSSNNDTASIVSSANSIEEVSSQQHAATAGAGTGALMASGGGAEMLPQTHQPQQPVGSIVLQRHNQSALNLKANLEQLKGNVTRSLILCSEANGATGDNPFYEAIHANNLGIVYGTTHKRHLALHALAKGLLHAKESRFLTDGTACPSPTLFILYNSAIAALQAGNYLSAYECMATCVSRSSTFDQSPKCWLRMAEACLGVYHSHHASPNSLKKFSAVEINGEPRGLIFNRSKVAEEPLVKELGTAEDMEQVERSPLLRARKSLEHALARSDEKDADEDEATIMATCLSLAYVCLAFRDFGRALELSTRVLQRSSTTLVSSGGGVSCGETTADDSVALRVYRRCVATARMYAAEASCALGEAGEAYKFLVGDGQADAFDRLASDLGGVTIETAASNGKGKRRLARAQTMVRSSASAATAAMGNLTAAKQLAMSAQAMEDAYESNRERSSARRALIYCLLRGDNHSAALSLLQSMRSK